VSVIEPEKLTRDTATHSDLPVRDSTDPA
jgi:hypothetical protein